MKHGVLFPELSYRLNGLLFQVHNELGRFCRERQYSNKLEKLLQEQQVPYLREVNLSSFGSGYPEGNRADFVIDGKIVIELKAKPIVVKDDYYQMQRYLRGSGLELGFIVNFRNKYLKPKRILNTSLHSGHSDAHSDYSDRV